MIQSLYLTLLSYVLFLNCSGEAYVHVPTPAVGASLPENPVKTIEIKLKCQLEVCTIVGIFLTWWKEGRERLY